jgi:hypothetical protein
MKHTIPLAALFLLAVVSCKDPLIEQIRSVHHENVELEKETALKIDQLIQLRNGINIQGRALTEDEVVVVGEIDAIEQRWLDWKKSFRPLDPETTPKTSRETLLKDQQALLQSLQQLGADAAQMLEAPF